jgi:hypothetical protein
MRRTVTTKIVEKNLDVSIIEDMTAECKCNRNRNGKKRNSRRVSTIGDKMGK